MLTAHAPQILDSYAQFIKMVIEEFAETGVEFDGISTPRQGFQTGKKQGIYFWKLKYKLKCALLVEEILI